MTDTAWPLVAGLSAPAVVIDERGTIVFLNPKSELFWGVRLADVAGRRAVDALRIRPPDGRAVEAWAREVVAPALTSGASVSIRVTGYDGRTHTLALTGMWQVRDGARHAVLILREDRDGAPPAVDGPGPLTDPVTGLPKLHAGAPVYRQWDARGGTLLLFDIEGLREINALYGPRAGDQALRTVAQVLTAHTPRAALAARHAEDQFVILLDGTGGATPHLLAHRVAAEVAQEAAGRSARRPRLHHGAARFAAGGLGRALGDALDDLYERRGALLRARAGGRLVLTREGREAVQEPGGEGPHTAAGVFAANFGQDFERYFDQAYARSVQQAREFVDFAAPRAGTAVVEVGAGSGRLTFAGGLAERVGRGGQLLVTDPSPAQLQVARHHAKEMGLDWVRFLCAPVEALPLAAGTADLCLGAAFLHFTNAERAIGAMARVVGVGGCVAISAILELHWTPPWLHMLEPVFDAARAHGRAPLDVLAPRPALERAFRRAGLAVDVVDTQPDRAHFPSAEVALGVWRQTRFARLMLQDVPEEEAAAAEAGFEARLRGAYERSPSEDLAYSVAMISVLGHRAT